MHKLKKNQSGFGGAELLLIIVIVALLGVVGWLVYKDNHKTTPIATSKTTSATDPTSGWGTFTSSLGGFSFKYPTTGWLFEGAGSNTNSRVTGSAITSASPSFALIENAGHGLSTTNAYYSFNFNIGNLGYVGPITGVSETYLYGQGSVIGTLSNGLSLWQTSEKTFNNPQEGCGANGNGYIILNIASKGNLYIQLPNGEYLSVSAGFCNGPQQTLTLTYLQQLNSPESIVAKDLLASIKFK